MEPKMGPKLSFLGDDKSCENHVKYRGSGPNPSSKKRTKKKVFVLLLKRCFVVTHRFASTGAPFLGFLDPFVQ